MSTMPHLVDRRLAVPRKGPDLPPHPFVGLPWKYAIDAAALMAAPPQEPAFHPNDLMNRAFDGKAAHTGCGCHQTSANTPTKTSTVPPGFQELASAPFNEECGTEDGNEPHRVLSVEEYLNRRIDPSMLVAGCRDVLDDTAGPSTIVHECRDALLSVQPWAGGLESSVVDLRQVDLSEGFGGPLLPPRTSPPRPHPVKETQTRPGGKVGQHPSCHCPASEGAESPIKTWTKAWIQSCEGALRGLTETTPRMLLAGEGPAPSTAPTVDGLESAEYAQEAAQAGALCDRAAAPFSRRENEFHIDYQSFERNFPEFSRDEIQTVVLRAAATWNAESTSGWFVYRGDSAQCGRYRCDCNIVRARESVCGTSVAHRAMACGGRRWRVEICRNRRNGARIDWSIDAGGFRDLQGILVHEFGHAIGLGHPPNGIPSVMAGTIGNRTTLRNLREWDTRCLSELYGDRRTRAVVVEQNGVAFGQAGAVPPRPVATHASPSLIPLGNHADWSLGYYHEGHLRVHNWSAGSDVAHPSGVVTGPRLLFEAGGGTGLLYVRRLPDEPAPGNQFLGAFSRGPLVQERWAGSSTFRDPSPPHALLRCTLLGANGRCHGHRGVSSPRVMSTARDPRTGETIYAWTNYDNTSEATNRRVLVSVGRLDQHKLRPALELQAQTGAAPAVACSQRGWPGREALNCILAFVPQDDRTARVRILPLGVRGDAENRRAHIIPSGVTTEARTADDLALWFATDRYWMALRSLAPGQPTEVWSSFDGVAWLHTNNLEASIVGPAVQNNFETNRTRLVLIRPA